MEVEKEEDPKKRKIGLVHGASECSPPRKATKYEFDEPKIPPPLPPILATPEDKIWWARIVKRRKERLEKESALFAAVSTIPAQFTFPNPLFEDSQGFEDLPGYYDSAVDDSQPDP